MSRGTWGLIKQSKLFYILTYRRTSNMLVVSVILNLLLGLAVYYSYFQWPDHNYYATNGITYPDRLISMDAPNRSSVALLAPDVIDNNDATVPQQ